MPRRKRPAQAGTQASFRLGIPPGCLGGCRRIRRPLCPRHPYFRAGAGSSWEPVEVPKPTYVEAPKAERPAPEPLDLPEAPKPVGKPILKLPPPPPPPPRIPHSTRLWHPLQGIQCTLSNLDDVLQRRRA